MQFKNIKIYLFLFLELGKDSKLRTNPRESAENLMENTFFLSTTIDFRNTDIHYQNSLWKRDL